MQYITIKHTTGERSLKLQDICDVWKVNDNTQIEDREDFQHKDKYGCTVLREGGSCAVYYLTKEQYDELLFRLINAPK